MKNRRPDGHWLISKACAHRGFHGDGAPENSVLAFERAIDRDFPIETDVQLTSDLIPVCFHDDNLKRITGKDALIWDTTFEEVRTLKILETNQNIITFEEFLKLVDGRVPLLIEIKSQPKNAVVVQKVIELLDGYKGDYVIQSFDPRIMKIVRKLRPSIIRGQLMCKDRHKNLSLLVDKLVSNGFLNFLSKPDFINMNQKYLPVSRRVRKNKRVLCWTVVNQEQEENALKFVQGYVFENINPKLK